MTEVNLGFALSYEGNDAENHQIDFYDVAQALIGFQRSLALTTHLILNNEVITQSPALKGARIIVLPPEEGSWKIMTTIAFLAAGTYHLGTTPKDTPIGNLISSAYDYVISETLGFHVDYSKTLGQQYEELKKKQKLEIPVIHQSQLDSVIEKCEPNIIQMHRPIIFSETAKCAKLTHIARTGETSFEHSLNRETYNFVKFEDQSESTYEMLGRISSYNINTFNGRIFIAEEKRPIPFHLAVPARNPESISRITRSLTMNAHDSQQGNLCCIAFKNLSRTGRLKSIYIVEVKSL